MVDRRALVIGSWLAKGRDKPSQQKVKSITKRWEKIFQNSDFGFHSLTNKRKRPAPLLNPTPGELVTVCEAAKDIGKIQSCCSVLLVTASVTVLMMFS
jgi:hypothetical protein